MVSNWSFSINRTTIQLGFVLAALLISGCSERTYKVHGQVVYEDNDQPVPGGVTIVFESTEPPYARASGNLDAEGRFDLSSSRPGDGAMQGEHRVRFTADVGPGRPDAAANMAQYMAAKYAEYGTADIKLNIDPNDDNDFTIKVARPAKGTKTPPASSAKPSEDDPTNR